MGRQGRPTMARSSYQLEEKNLHSQVLKEMGIEHTTSGIRSSDIGLPEVLIEHSRHNPP